MGDFDSESLERLFGRQPVHFGSPLGTVGTSSLWSKATSAYSINTA
jgi:hypothetical protein